MTVVDGDVIRTTANFTLRDGSLYQNVYHHILEGTAPFGDATVVTALDTWLTSVYDAIRTHVTVTAVGNLCSVDKVAWDGAKWAVVSNLGTFVHTFVPVGAGDEMPNQVSPFVTFKTERPKSVGRKFLFPLLETSFTEGQLTSTVVAILVAYANLVLADVNLSPLNDLVPGIPRTGADVFLVFLLAIVTNIAGTQRKRRLGAGA